MISIVKRALKYSKGGHIRDGALPLGLFALAMAAVCDGDSLSRSPCSLISLILSRASRSAGPSGEDLTQGHEGWG